VPASLCCLLRGTGGSQRRNATACQFLIDPLITKPRLTSRAAPDWGRQQLKCNHSFPHGQRDDIADSNGQASLFHAASVDADVPSLRPNLGKGPALGKSQKEQKFVDPQLRPVRLELKALKRRQLQREGGWLCTLLCNNRCALRLRLWFTRCRGCLALRLGTRLTLFGRAWFWQANPAPMRQDDSLRVG